MSEKDEKKRKRKAHSKSRNGCINCKRLRIKCDELKPNCSNCIRRKKECEYAPPKPQDFHKSNKHISPVGTSSRSNSSSSISSVDSITSVGSYGGSSLSASSSYQQYYYNQLWQRATSQFLPVMTRIDPITPPESFVRTPLELELMNHYCSSVPNVIMLYGVEDQLIWENYVPQLTMANSFLAHGVLAISALHLDFLSNGARNLSAYALDQYYRAMASFNVLKTQHDNTNVEALFISSAFMMMLGFCFQGNVPLIGNGLVPDLLSVVRGPAIVSRLMGPMLINTGVRQIIANGDIPITDATQFPETTVLHKLLNACDVLESLGLIGWDREIESVSIGRTNLNRPDVEYTRPTTEIYKEVLNVLICCAKESSLSLRPSVLVGWLMKVPDEFLNFIRLNFPFSRVILGYYLLCLHALRNYFWIDNRPVRELYMVYNTLDDRWKPLLDLPLELVKLEDMTLDKLWYYLCFESAKLDVYACLQVNFQGYPVSKIADIS